jgi:RNA polymerase sigma-70 factor (ECF subfamily)
VVSTLDFEPCAASVEVADERPARPACVSPAHETVIGNDDVTADRSTDVAADAAMDRYAAGESDAFAILYDLLAPRLYGFLMRQTRNPSRAEDLVQQTMLHIHCARGRFIRGAPVMPWAFAIARRLLIDETRKSRLDGARTSDPEGYRAFENAVAGDVPADDQVQSSQVAKMIRRELDRLPEQQRVAFELVKHEGLTHAEAAEILGTTVTAIKLRAHRTYEALRAALGPAFDLGDV